MVRNILVCFHGNSLCIKSTPVVWELISEFLKISTCLVEFVLTPSSALRPDNYVCCENIFSGSRSFFNCYLA